MATENQDFKIVDYCFLDGNDPKTWGSWCSWAIQDINSSQNKWKRWIFNEWKTYDSTFTLFSDGDGGCVGGPNAYQGSRHRDYWLKIKVPENTKQVKNLRLAYNGSNSQKETWVATVFNEQSDVMYAPIASAGEHIAADTTCQIPTSLDKEETYTPPYAYDEKIYQDSSILLPNDKGEKLPIKPITENGQMYFNLSFSCNKQAGSYYYINIKRKVERNSNHTAAHLVGTGENLWELKKTDDTEITQTYQVTYNIHYKLFTADKKIEPKTTSFSKEIKFGEEHTIFSPQALFIDGQQSFPTGYETDVYKEWKIAESNSSESVYIPIDGGVVEDTTILQIDLKPKSYGIKLIGQIYMNGEPFQVPDNNVNILLSSKPKIITYLLSNNENIEFTISDNNYYSLTTEPTYSIMWEDINENSTEVSIKVPVDAKVFWIKSPNNQTLPHHYYEIPKSQKYIAKIYSTDDDDYREGKLVECDYKPTITLSDTSSQEEPNILFNDTEQFNLELILQRQIDGWKNQDDTNYNINSVEVEFVAENAKDNTNKPIETPKYYVKFSQNGVYLDNVYQKTLDNFIQLPYKEDGTELFWSLTAKNGAPHYRSGDYVGTHKITKLWSTTENGSDYSIFIKKEDGWK